MIRDTVCVILKGFPKPFQLLLARPMAHSYLRYYRYQRLGTSVHCRANDTGRAVNMSDGQRTLFEEQDSAFGRDYCFPRFNLLEFRNTLFDSLDSWMGLAADGNAAKARRKLAFVHAYGPILHIYY